MKLMTLGEFFLKFVCLVRHGLKVKKNNLINIEKKVKVTIEGEEMIRKLSKSIREPKKINITFCLAAILKRNLKRFPIFLLLYF